MMKIVVFVSLILSAGLSLSQTIVGNPTATQTITQPVGTSLNDNTFNSVRWVASSYNWSQSPSADLTVPGA